MRKWAAHKTSTSFTVRVPNETADKMKKLVEDGTLPNINTLINAAITKLLQEHEDN